MLEVTLTAEKTTKNTVRYREEETEEIPPVFKTLYIQKEALGLLGSTRPEKLKVTVEVV